MDPRLLDFPSVTGGSLREVSGAWRALSGKLWALEGHARKFWALGGSFLEPKAPNSVGSESPNKKYLNLLACCSRSGGKVGDGTSPG